jgi:hypothetical protein
MNLKIFIPQKVAIYLPLYIAKERGMFEGYLLKHGINRVDIVPPNQNEEGDINAIKNMHDVNQADNNVIAIAIADPTSFLIPEKITTKTDIRVIGALINKPPFWAIDHKQDELNEIGDFRKEFDVVIHNGDEYATGSLIGKRVRGTHGNIKSEIAGYGEEIEKLKDLSKDTNNQRVVAITTDIISIAKAEVNDRLSVNFSFAGERSEFNYITTGILTSKSCCDKYPDILIEIIKIFKTTINELYREEGTVRMVLNEIAKEAFNCTITEEEHKVIYRLFSRGNFYDKDLIVSEKLWKNSVALQTDVHFGFMFVTEDERQKREQLKKDSFIEYVDNSFALKANTFPGIRIFFAKHKVKKRTTKSFITILIIYVLFAVVFWFLSNKVFKMNNSAEILIGSIIIPAILALFQKFGIDNIK